MVCATSRAPRKSRMHRKTTTARRTQRELHTFRQHSTFVRADLSESDSATHYCIGLDTSKMEMMPAAFPRNIGYISPSRSRAVANANTEDMPTVRWNPTFSKSLPFLGSEHTRPMPQLTMTRSKRSARSARSATLPSPQEFPAPTPDNTSEVDSPGTADLLRTSETPFGIYQ